MSNALTRVMRLIDTLSAAMAYVSGFVCLIVAVHISIDAIGRTFFNRPLPGTLEMNTYWWMPTIIFLGLAVAQLRDEHLKVTLISDALSGPVRWIAELIAMVLMIATILLMLIYMWHSAVRATEIGEAAIGVIEIPIWPFKWVALLGLCLFLLQSLASLVRMILPGPAREEKASS